MTALGLLLCAGALLMLPGARARVPSLRSSEVRPAYKHSRAVVLGLVSVVGAGSLALLGGAHAVCASVILGWTVWTRRRKSQVRAERRRGLDSLAAGLEIVIGELRVGSHPALACASAAAESTGSVADAFSRAAGRARLGGDPFAGLQMPDSPVHADLQRLATAWRIADRRGLALAELLSAARSDMLARRRFRERTEAGLAGARATGTVLACLPVLGVVLGQFMGASPLGVLFGGGLGGILLVVGSLLACAGLLWTDAITERVCR